MNLKSEEVLCKPSPCSLQHFALAAWINGRKNWDPDLGLHLCKVSKTINDIVFDWYIRNVFCMESISLYSDVEV